LLQLRSYLNEYFLIYLPKTIYKKIPLELKDITVLISAHSKKINNFFFIQIGSNDGVRDCPIRKLIIKNNWKGILVEPVKYIFQKLKKNYKNQNNLIFENAAISKEKGYRKFYRVKKHDEKGNPFQYDMIGSFFPEVVIKHKKYISDFDKHFITEKIKCITFQDLTKKHKVKKIDLLQIDVEGYDYEIIKSIDFGKIKPKIIIYEEKHLNRKEKKRCRRFLKNKGYSIIPHGEDVFAYIS